MAAIKRHATRLSRRRRRHQGERGGKEKTCSEEFYDDFTQAQVNAPTLKTSVDVYACKSRAARANLDSGSSARRNSALADVLLAGRSGDL